MAITKKAKFTAEDSSISESANSTNPDLKLVSDAIKPLELNVRGHLNVNGDDLQAVVDKLNELIKKG